MDNKIVGIIVVTALVAAAIAGGAYIATYKADTSMNYSILDDPESSLKAGLTIVTDSDNERIMVKIVEVDHDTGAVNYNKKYEIVTDNYDAGTIEDFEMDRLIPFDIDDEKKIPSGITVTKDGNTLIINGKGSASAGPLLNGTMMYDNLTIVFDGKIPKKINGSVDISLSYMSHKFALKGIFNTDAEGHVAIMGCAITYQDSMTAESRIAFIEKEFHHFNELDYTGCVITDGEKESYSGRDCDVKIINGKSTVLHDKFQDYHALCYKGFFVKGSGLIDDKQGEKTITYFYG
ncbi:MAG: hypothetical protein MJZ21_04095 [archaeon]|nr:hypothetical protein [archaeon]